MKGPTRRSIILGVLLVCGGTITLAMNQAPAGAGQGRGAAGAAPVIQVDRLRDNLFVLRGGGGNTAVFVGSDGVTVVDTKIPGWGQPLLAKIKELTDKPVTRIINSHTHYDHVGGNVDFPTSVDVVAHANTKVNMERGLPPKGAESRVPPDVFKANGGRNIAKRTFRDTMTIGSGAERIDLYYFGRGHTDGDAWTVFPALRVMHAGDIFSGKLVPLLDSNNGGSGLEIADTLAKAATLKDIDAIITGHSTVMTVADLKEYSEFNREFLDYVRAAKKAGRSVEDAAAGYAFPAKYAGYRAPQPDSIKNNIEVIYAELK
jgi:glyoxylase-like metal-dependent hydrolase (beta-lactamase superfamily II)